MHQIAYFLVILAVMCAIMDPAEPAPMHAAGHGGQLAALLLAAAAPQVQATEARKSSSLLKTAADQDPTSVSP